jgi:hypothetical protein
VPARHESVHIHYRSLIETVSMRQAAAWKASILGHPPLEWSVSLPRMIDMRNAHVWDTWRQHNSYLDAKMGSVEWITPSTLAIPVMRNSTRMKHVAHIVWLYKKEVWHKVRCWRLAKYSIDFYATLKNPKFPLGPLDLEHSLTIQRVFKIQSILASLL